MRIIGIVNQKGGCGKTTTAVQLASAAAAAGRRVLLVDMDPQAHCALALSIPERRIDRHVGDLLADARSAPPAGECIWPAARNLDLLPSTMRLAALEAAGGGLASAADRESRLASALATLAHRYDVVYLDSPPHIGLLTYNVIRAATELLVPVEASYFSLRGAERQVATIAALADRLDASLPYRLLPTMHHGESRLAADLLAELRRCHEGRVAPMEVRWCEAIREASSFGSSIYEYAPDSSGARDYLAVLEWLDSDPMHAERAARPSRRVAPPPAPTPGAAEPASGGRSLEIVARTRVMMDQLRSGRSGVAAGSAPGAITGSGPRL